MNKIKLTYPKINLLNKVYFDNIIIRMINNRNSVILIFVNLSLFYK